MGSTAAARATYLAFHHNSKLHTLQTTVSAIWPFSALEEANRALFKQGTDGDYAVVTSETIFHPQGGGQPSDEGTISSSFSPSSTFRVDMVRMDALNPAQVLHFGRFLLDSSSPTTTDEDRPEEEAKAPFQPGDSVKQVIDAEKRLFYSRLHTAGHVLGSAVRHLLQDEVEGFDELKASHFPGSAACEFQGLIEGRWKAPLQARVDEYVARAMPVEIEFWGEDEFRRNGLERLIPDRAMLPPGEDKFRVVRIVGAEVYPCGGTHVDSTDLCGEITVKKISRSKRVSRVSYSVKP